MNNSVSLVANGCLVQSSNLTARKSLTVTGTTTGDGSQMLALNGDTFSTGSVSSGGLVQFSTGTFRLTSASLTVGDSGLFGPTLQLGANQHLDISNGAINARSDGSGAGEV